MEKKKYSFKLIQIRVSLKCIRSVFQINLKKGRGREKGREGEGEKKRERERGHLTSSVNKCQDEKKDLRILPPSLPDLTHGHYPIQNLFLPSLAHPGRKTTPCHHDSCEQHQK